MTEPGRASPLDGLGARDRKALVREHLAAGRLDAVADLAEDTHKVIGFLISLTYDHDPLVAWRAVEAAGLAADRIADRERRTVRNYLRRLFWLITEESGGICWFAPQAMAEIARTRHDFDDFVPIVMNLINEMADEDLEHFRPGILWAIGRLGPQAAEHAGDVMAELDRAMGHPDPQVRGLAVWAAGQIGQGARVAMRPQLRKDQAPVRLYRDGAFVETTVGTLARRAGAETGPPRRGTLADEDALPESDATADEPGHDRPWEPGEGWQDDGDSEPWRPGQGGDRPWETG